MSKATYVTVIAANRHGERYHCLFQLTRLDSDQRADLRNIVKIDAFEQAETVDHNVSFNLGEFLEAIATAQNVLSPLKAMGDQFSTNLLDRVSEIREFVRHEHEPKAFVHVA